MLLWKEGRSPKDNLTAAQGVGGGSVLCATALHRQPGANQIDHHMQGQRVSDMGVMYSM